MPRSSRHSNRLRDQHGRAERRNQSATVPSFSRARVSSNVISVRGGEHGSTPGIDFVATRPPSAAHMEGVPVAAFTQALREIKERLQRIEDRLPPEESAVELRDIADDVALKESAAFFAAHAGETLYYSDLSDALRLPLEQVVRICGRLIEEGAIGLGEHS